MNIIFFSPQLMQRPRGDGHGAARRNADLKKIQSRWQIRRLMGAFTQVMQYRWVLEGSGTIMTNHITAVVSEH